MATAIRHGKTHEVRCDLIIPKNYGVAVLGLEEAARATVNLGIRKAAQVRYKIHADSPEAATRKALHLMKEAGTIDDYTLEAHERLPDPEPVAAPKTPPKVPPANAG